MDDSEYWVRTHCEGLPTAALLQFALSSKPDEWIVATSAFGRIEDYLMAARVQMSRIWADLLASDDMFQAAKVRDGGDVVAGPNWDAHGQGFELHRLAFIDIHFYFNCWDSVRKMLRLLNKDLKTLKTPSLVFTKHRMELDHYSDARHNLEHFDERLPGKRNASKAVSPPDSLVSGASYLGYGNLIGGEYRFGPDSWDVTPNSLQRLEAVVADLDAGIREETIAMLIEQQQARRAG